MKRLYTDTPHNMNNVQMEFLQGERKSPSLNCVQHERQKLFWRHIPGSSKINL